MVKEDFTELKHGYRVRVEQFSTQKIFVSHEFFETYEDAWNYAKESTKQFDPCGFCVIYCEEPELEFNLDFSYSCDKE